MVRQASSGVKGGAARRFLPRGSRRPEHSSKAPGGGAPAAALRRLRWVAEFHAVQRARTRQGMATIALAQAPVARHVSPAGQPD